MSCRSWTYSENDWLSEQTRESLEWLREWRVAWLGWPYLTHLKLDFEVGHIKSLTSPLELPSLKVLCLDVSALEINPRPQPTGFISNLSTPLLSIVSIEGGIDEPLWQDIERFLIRHKDTITSLIIMSLQCWSADYIHYLPWEGTDVFWRTFSKLSFFAVPPHWFSDSIAIYRLPSIASTLPLITVIFDDIGFDNCVKNVKRLTSRLIDWCLRCHLCPIKRVALTGSWSLFVRQVTDRKLYAERCLPNVKVFVDGIYGSGISLCDGSEVDFYDDMNEKLHRALNWIEFVEDCKAECWRCHTVKTDDDR